MTRLRLISQAKEALLKDYARGARVNTALARVILSRTLPPKGQLSSHLPAHQTIVCRGRKAPIVLCHRHRHRRVLGSRIRKPGRGVRVGMADHAVSLGCLIRQGAGKRVYIGSGYDGAAVYSNLKQYEVMLYRF